MARSGKLFACEPQIHNQNKTDASAALSCRRSFIHHAAYILREFRFAVLLWRQSVAISAAAAHKLLPALFFARTTLCQIIGKLPAAVCTVNNSVAGAQIFMCAEMQLLCPFAVLAQARDVFFVIECIQLCRAHGSSFLCIFKITL